MERSGYYERRVPWEGKKKNDVTPFIVPFLYQTTFSANKNLMVNKFTYISYDVTA